jgi:hypothetical protein
MAQLAIVDTLTKGDSGRKTRGVLRVTILCLIAVAAIASRLFSVIREYSTSQWSLALRSIDLDPVC